MSQVTQVCKGTKRKPDEGHTQLLQRASTTKKRRKRMCIIPSTKKKRLQQEGRTPERPNAVCSGKGDTDGLSMNENMDDTRNVSEQFNKHTVWTNSNGHLSSIHRTRGIVKARIHAVCKRENSVLKTIEEREAKRSTETSLKFHTAHGQNHSCKHACGSMVLPDTLEVLSWQTDACTSPTVFHIEITRDMFPQEQ